MPKGSQFPLIQHKKYISTLTVAPSGRPSEPFAPGPSFRVWWRPPTCSLSSGIIAHITRAISPSNETRIYVMSPRRITSPEPGRPLVSKADAILKRASLVSFIFKLAAHPHSPLRVEPSQTTPRHNINSVFITGGIWQVDCRRLRYEKLNRRHLQSDNGADNKRMLGIADRRRPVFDQ